MSEVLSRSRRGPFFWIGLVLWGAVVVTLAAKWQRARSQQEEVQQASIAEAAQSASSVDAEPMPDEQPVVQITWSETGLPDFEFTDASGDKITKNDLLGKPWVASFIFTRCAGTCPRVTNSIDVLQRRYKEKDVRFVTFTVDPDFDTVDVLKHYSDKLEADPARWMFLTGDKDKLYSLINQDFLMPAMPSEKPEPGWEIIHTNNVCLVDSTGRVIGKYNSLEDAAVVELRHDLDRLLESHAAEPADVEFR